MKHKDKVLNIFLNWEKMVETHTSKTTKALRSYNMVITPLIHFPKFIEKKA